MRHDAVSRLPLTRLVPLVLALVALVITPFSTTKPGSGAWLRAKLPPQSMKLRL